MPGNALPWPRKGHWPFDSLNVMEPGVHYIAVVPAFNEEDSVRSLVQGVAEQVDRIIVVDDGSTDRTCSCLEGLAVTLVRNKENRGKGASLQRGFLQGLQGKPAAIISLDADGQHRPEDIPFLLAAHKDHPDRIIIGARTKNRGAAPLLRRFANRVADFFVSWAAGHRIQDSQSGFRLYPAAFLSKVDLEPEAVNTFVFESEILIKASRMGLCTKSVDIETIYRDRSGASNYRPWTDTLKITRMVAASLLSRGMYPVGLFRILGLLPDPGKNKRTGSSQRVSGDGLLIVDHQ